MERYFNTDMRRIAALDMIRGLAIWFLVAFHAMERALNPTIMGDFLANAPLWQMLIMGPLFMLMSWRGLFLLISAAVHSVVMEEQYRTIESRRKLIPFMLMQILIGIIIFFLGVWFQLWWSPYGAVSHWALTGVWNGTITIYYLHFSDAIETIGLGQITVSLVLGIFYLIQGPPREETRTNRFALTRAGFFLFAMIIIFLLTPVIIDFVQTRYGLGPPDIQNQSAASFAEHAKLLYLACLVGWQEPLFPYLAVIFLGATIGIILAQPQWIVPRKTLTFVLIGQSLILTGFLKWVFVDHFSPISQFMIAPTWFLLIMTGLQVDVIVWMLQIIDFTKKNRFRRIRNTRFLRRMGLVSLTIFTFQFLDILPRWILFKITNQDYLNASTLTTLSQGFLLMGVVLVYWAILIWIWEKLRFYLTFDWFFRIFLSLIRGKKIYWKDPLHIYTHLYQIENPKLEFDNKEILSSIR